MNSFCQKVISQILQRSGLEWFPVRVRGGLAAGARWTLFPGTAYWRGRHEPAMQAAMLALGGGDIRGWSCWDLGAHFGIYSVGLARRVGPAGQVAAFEPDPKSYRRLAHHARINRLPWLKAFHAAVSDHSGPAELYTYGRPGATSSHLPYEGESREAACRPVGIDRVRLDDLVQSGEIRPPHFVKLDVEGHGHRALAGMAETLRLHRPILIAAFHSPAEHQGVMDRTGPLNYDCRPVDPEDGATDPFIGRDFLFTPRSR